MGPGVFITASDDIEVFNMDNLQQFQGKIRNIYTFISLIFNDRTYDGQDLIIEKLR